MCIRAGWRVNKACRGVDEQKVVTGGGNRGFPKRESEREREEREKREERREKRKKR